MKISIKINSTLKKSLISIQGNFKKTQIEYFTVQFLNIEGIPIINLSSESSETMEKMVLISISYIYLKGLFFCYFL